jgi:type IV fimbrial biogenesis protein FimT
MNLTDAKIGTDGRRQHAAARGFTLIEMMITIFVAAVLLVIGVPSFRDAALGARLTNIANDLNASVQLARSEAIKANVPVTLCRSTDGAACADAGDWERGWIVLDNAGAVLQVQQAVPTGFKVTRTVGTGNMLFQPIGVGASQATFTVCRSAPVGKQERTVEVSATGAVRVRTAETGVCP